MESVRVAIACFPDQELPFFLGSYRATMMLYSLPSHTRLFTCLKTQFTLYCVCNYAYISYSSSLQVHIGTALTVDRRWYSETCQLVYRGQGTS